MGTLEIAIIVGLSLSFFGAYHLLYGKRYNKVSTRAVSQQEYAIERQDYMIRLHEETNQLLKEVVNNTRSKDVS